MKDKVFAAVEGISGIGFLLLACGYDGFTAWWQYVLLAGLGVCFAVSVTAGKKSRKQESGADQAEKRDAA